MSSMEIVGENVEVIQTGTTGARPALSWSVALAGALAALAVSFIFIALGSGIGLAVSSPFSGPSIGTLTVAGAVWLIIAQTFGFATGGYIAGRLRIRTHIPGPETTFRDAAHGFMAWAIGVAFTAVTVFAIGAYSARTAADVAGSIGSGAAQGATLAAGRNAPSDAVAYYVDRLFRTDPAAAPSGAPAAAPGGATDASNAPGAATANGGSSAADAMPRAEVTRIMLAALRDGELSEGDRTYLARVIAARTGIAPDEAERRVAEVQKQAVESMRSAADTARKAGSYLSFWSFMSLLFGAMAATLGGMLGGQLRDET